MQQITIILCALSAVFTLSAQATINATNNATASSAVPNNSQNNPKNNPNQSPEYVVRNTITKLNQLGSRHPFRPGITTNLINQTIAPLFDFDYISNEVLAIIHENFLTQSEHTFFVKRLKQEILFTLMKKLTQGGTKSFRFVAARPVIGGAMMVQMRVKGFGMFSTPISLLFHQNENQQWKIFDVIINRSSLINYYQKMLLVKVRRYGVRGMLGKI